MLHLPCLGMIQRPLSCMTVCIYLTSVPPPSLLVSRPLTRVTSQHNMIHQGSGDLQWGKGLYSAGAAGTKQHVLAWILIPRFVKKGSQDIKLHNGDFMGIGTSPLILDLSPWIEISICEPQKYHPLFKNRNHKGQLFLPNSSKIRNYQQKIAKKSRTWKFFTCPSDGIKIEIINGNLYPFYIWKWKH